VHYELLTTALRLLATHDGGLPLPTDLRRAVSTTYYALFHFVIQSSVEILMPNTKRPLLRAKQQAYRSIDHRDIKGACLKSKDPEYGAPAQVRRLADTFLDLNKHRERADYDPSVHGEFHIKHVLDLIGECETAIAEFKTADIDDRRAFAVQVCLKSKARP
jgi:hypothetical protein